MEKAKESKKEKTVTNLHQNPILLEFSAGGVVFRRENEISLWLITKSNPSSLYPEAYWRLPKGWLDDESDGKFPGPLARGDRKASQEEVESAAIREVKEEGGVNAKIIKRIGTEKRFFLKEGKRVLKFIVYFLMEYVSDEKDGFGLETSEVGWFPYEEARKKLKYSGEKKVLEKAKQLLDSGIQNSLI